MALIWVYPGLVLSKGLSACLQCGLLPNFVFQLPSKVGASSGFRAALMFHVNMLEICWQLCKYVCVLLPFRAH